MNHALVGRPVDLLPSPQDPFFRPLSRGLYLQLRLWAGGHGPLLGHVLNSCLLAAVVVQLVLLARRLAGQRAALVAGVHSRSIPVPSLPPPGGGAMALTALSLISKETAIAVVPPLAALDWLLRRPPYLLRRRFVLYGGLVILWTLVTPASGARSPTVSEAVRPVTSRRSARDGSCPEPERDDQSPTEG